MCQDIVPKCLLSVLNVQEEVDRVLGDSSTPDMAQYKELKYTMRCINESMRLFPHPPVLQRRALREDTLPNGLTVPKGQDVMLAIYNIHMCASITRATVPHHPL